MRSIALSSASLFAHVTSAMTEIFRQSAPDVVIVQGDTISAMATSAVAFYAHVHVIHVEAGLRTGDLSAPYPEEYNRKAISLVCTLCFAPTTLAENALIAEGLPKQRIFTVGNTVVDQLLESSTHPPPEIASGDGVVLKSIMADKKGQSTLVLNQTTEELLKHDKHIVLITVHRRESAISGAFHGIGTGIGGLASFRPDVTFILSVHYNPAVRQHLLPPLRNIKNVWLVEPPAYPVFVQALLRVTVLLTDSGGLQEEALSLHLPVLIMRDKTERMEGVFSGGAQLVGTSFENIHINALSLLSNQTQYQEMVSAENPYGDGKAASRIISIITDHRRILRNKPSTYLKFNVPKRPIHLKMNSTLPPAVNHVDLLSSRFSKGEITVVLTGYKRPASQLERQIQAIKNSTLVPRHIYFYQNHNFIHEFDFATVLAKHPDVRHIDNVNHNTFFHGRFTVCLLVDTEYCAIVDDEPLPGTDFIKLHSFSIHSQIVIYETRNEPLGKPLTLVPSACVVSLSIVVCS